MPRASDVNPRGWRAPPPRDGFADALEEARDWRDASFEEHYRGLRDAIDLAFAILERHPDRERLLAWQDPLPADARAIIDRLRASRR